MFPALQDFQRLHQVEQLARACCALRAEQGEEQLRLPQWIRRYAAAAWQDRFFAESNFRPLQQARRDFVVVPDQAPRPGIDTLAGMELVQGYCGALRHAEHAPRFMLHVPVCLDKSPWWLG